MHWIIFFVLTSYAVTVHSQTWTGVFNIDSSCETESCCCLSNQIVMTRPTTDTISFNVSLAGTFCMGTTSYSGTADYPTEYMISVEVSIITITFELNDESTMLTISSSLGDQCTSYATRVVTSTSSTTTMPAVVTTTTMRRNNTAAANQNVNLALMAGFVTFNMIMRN